MHVNWVGDETIAAVMAFVPSLLVARLVLSNIDMRETRYTDMPKLSCNTQVCPGCGTSRSLVTSLSGCQTCNSRAYERRKGVTIGKGGGETGYGHASYRR